jgi:predicted Zn-dependent protease
MRLGRYAAAALAGGWLLSGCALSVNQELELGQDYAAQLARELPLVDDPAILADLELVTRRLTPHTRRREVTYRFYVVNDSTVNAFAVPGGYIYLFRGLIEAAGSMDQLAGVIGHEIGHVELRHSAEAIGRAQAAEAGIGVAGVLLGGRTGARVQQGATLAGTLVFAKFSRDDERESDSAGVALLTQAGVNPGGLAAMFETLQRLERSRPSAIAQWFASHPMTEDRIEDVNRRIAADPRATALLQTGERDAPEFERLRRNVRPLPPPPRRR